MKKKFEYLSGRFATKEAFSKALGTGLGKTVAFKDINCYNDIKGKPCILQWFYRTCFNNSYRTLCDESSFVRKEINSIIIK